MAFTHYYKGVGVGPQTVNPFPQGSLDWQRFEGTKQQAIKAVQKAAPVPAGPPQNGVGVVRYKGKVLHPGVKNTYQYGTPDWREFERLKQQVETQGVAGQPGADFRLGPNHYAKDTPQHKAWEEQEAYRGGGNPYQEGSPAWQAWEDKKWDFTGASTALPAGYEQRGGNFYAQGAQVAGKLGGAGNAVAGQSVDNSWDPRKGQDPRTAQQKFYDQNLTNYQQMSNMEGQYNWYGTVQPSTSEKRRNPDALPTTYNLDQRAKQAGQEGGQYWNYNNAPDQSFFENEIRSRQNKSLWSRGY